MDRIQCAIWNALCMMSGEDVAKVMTDYHGNQLLDEGFYEHMVNEGYMDDELDILNDRESEDE